MDFDNLPLIIIGVIIILGISFIFHYEMAKLRHNCIEISEEE